MMLQQADGDYEVTTLNSTEEAAELISQRSFDLYIFDQPWRNPSGLDLCRTVREHDGKAPILIFSVLSRDVDRQKGMMAGATEYLVKVEDINDLTSTVRRLLDGHAHSNVDGHGTLAGA
jgi:DNA-binding response OmpR family regulator